jgi:hypothetical protein
MTLASSRGASAAVFAFSLLAGAAIAQVPDGYIVFGSFQGTAGQNGIFFAHPRDPQAAWIEVTGLSPALANDPSGRRGASSLFRLRDGRLVAGERAPTDTSVDVHVLTLNGAHVVHAQLFSVGTSAGQGEVPQAAPLPDGRIVVAATGLRPGGPLSHFLTAQYQWEGIGILDPVGGGIVPVPIANLGSFPGVINGMAVSADGSTAYVGNYISTTSGDLWAVPLPHGGTAVQVATLPAGASNVAVDLDGTVLVTTLNGPPNLYRYDPVALTTTPVPTTTGPLNAIALETVTGNYVLATANAGVPVRALVWMTPGGAEHVLQSPNLATISCLDVNPNPEQYGTGTAGQTTYAWQLAPNPGGLPEAGNAAFSLTLTSAAAVPSQVLVAVSLGKAATTIAGVELLVDPTAAISYLDTMVGSPLVVPFAIPNDVGLRGLALFAQTLHLELVTTALASSPAVELTIL